jgi:hypothetical protein
MAPRYAKKHNKKSEKKRNWLFEVYESKWKQWIFRVQKDPAVRKKYGNLTKEQLEKWVCHSAQSDPENEQKPGFAPVPEMPWAAPPPRPMRPPAPMGPRRHKGRRGGHRPFQKPYRAKNNRQSNKFNQQPQFNKPHFS